MTTEEKFNENFDMLNALLSPHEFQVRTAYKEHIDLFGQPIKNGEDYYYRPIPPSVTSVQKVSQASMEVLMSIMLFKQSRGYVMGEVFAKEDHEARMAGLRAARDTLEARR